MFSLAVFLFVPAAWMDQEKPSSSTNKQVVDVVEFMLQLS